jgi:hypothetical protein
MQINNRELKALMGQYGVKENINMTAKKLDLRIKLFDA